MVSRGERPEACAPFLGSLELLRNVHLALPALGANRQGKPSSSIRLSGFIRSGGSVGVQSSERSMGMGSFSCSPTYAANLSLSNLEYPFSSIAQIKRRHIFHLAKGILRAHARAGGEVEVARASCSGDAGKESGATLQDVAAFRVGEHAT